MAHEVETMAFAHKVPWHGLGVRVDGDLTPAQMLTAAGLNWEVEKRPMFFSYGPNGDRIAGKVPGKMALVRKTDSKVFDVVGEGWNPVQNADVLATFKKFCDEGGATMETAGALRGGQIVWGLANLGNGFVLPGGDAVKGYLLLASKHQSGYATIGRVTPVRVVCANTFAMSGGFEGASQLRVPHTMKFDPDWAAEQMGIARAGMSEFERNARLLQKLNISPDDAKRILLPIYQPQEDPVDVMKDFDRRASRTVIEIMEAAVKGAGQAEIAGTAWGVFNAATYRANHNARGGADARFASTLVGQNNICLNRLYKGLVELAN